MSVSLWAYEPEKCDGNFCIGECDLCSKKFEKEGNMNGWISTRNMEPENDGTYLAQMAHGGLAGLDFTVEGGWNTHYDSKGNLHTESAISKLSVARWFDAPTPPEVPQAWFDEAVRR